MRFLIITIFVFESFVTFSQSDSAASFWQHQCELLTDGKGKSKGLIMSLSIPCSWKQKNRDMPKTIAWRSQHVTDTTSVSIVAMIDKSDITIPKQTVDNFLSQRGMREMLSKTQQFIKATRVTISGCPAAEIIYDEHQLLPGLDVFQYNISYFIFCKTWMITLTYSVGSAWVDKSQLYKERYTSLFRGLAASTLILNK